MSAVLMTSLQMGTGTLSMIGIVEAQNAQADLVHLRSSFRWAFLLAVFAIAMVAEDQSRHFPDLPEGESGISRGLPH